jgi:hypothetical protein
MTDRLGKRRSGIIQFRKPLAAVKLNIGDEGAQDVACRFRAEEQRFLITAHIQYAVRENMTPLMVCHQLNFINGDKGEFFLGGHRLNRADVIARTGWNDFLFARD